MTAAENGNIDIMKRLFEKTLEKHGKEKAIYMINKQTNEGKSALMAVCSVNQLDAVKFLIGKECNLLAETNDQKTAVTFACEKGFVDIFKVLLDAIKEKHGKDAASRILNLQTTKNVTLLCFAAGSGNAELIRLLLAEGSGEKVMGIATTEGLTPLLYASRQGQLEAVMVLLDGSDLFAKDSSKETVIFKAASGGHAEVLECLVTAIGKRYGKEKTREIVNFPSASGLSPLISAAVKKRLDVVTVSLELLFFCSFTIHEKNTVFIEGRER